MVTLDQACSDEALQYFTLQYSVRLVGYSRNMELDLNFESSKTRTYQNTYYIEHQASDPTKLGKENTKQNVTKLG